MSFKHWSMAVAAMVAAGAASIAQAQDAAAEPQQTTTESGGWFSGMDFSWGGFVRAEAAASTTDGINPNNQQGNVYNGQTVPRQAYLPPSILTITTGGIVPPLGLTWSSVPDFLATNGATPAVRPVATEKNYLGFANFRAELEGALKFNSEFSLIGRVRSVFDPGEYGGFNGASLTGDQGGIVGGDPALYGGAPNYFQYRVEGDKHPNPLEWDGPNYMVYFPALFLQYDHGPLNIRLGNQQIAWGQAIFFRVLDVVNGLDLRRHSILDYAQEEFSDKRVPSPALRVGYQINEDLLFDSFVEKFQPSILGNPNTQYNVIPSQFTVHDMYDAGGFENKVNFGGRFKLNLGQWGLQAMAVRRYNPDGAYRWTQSGVVRDLPGGFDLTQVGGQVNTFYSLPTVNHTYGNTTGEALSHTPFSVEPGGVYSADEWFYYAASARLNGLEGLNSAINDFPASQAIYGSAVTNVTDAAHELNTFFVAAGGSLRGHIAREYFAENVFGLGASYVVDGEPGSVLDQLIINVEASYTPGKTFTAPSLSKNFLQQDSYVGALVLEKYYRFTPAIPATYFVLQYMYRNADDLVGRSLKGYGGSGTSAPGAVDPTISPGVPNAQYVVFALQQPFPQDIFRFGLATLYDPRGGILVQPGLQWRPSSAISVDGFYSYINGHLSGNPNRNLLSSLDFADEFTLRLAYHF